jgi:hypothetical protein
MTATTGIVTAFTVLLLGLLVGAYVAAAWSPFLLRPRLRVLFRIGPTDEWWINYLLAADVVGVVHVTGYVTGTVLLGRVITPVEMLLYSGFGVAVFVMAIAGVVLPALGFTWKRDGYVTEFELLGAALWYAVITTLPPLILRGLSLVRS